MFLLYCCNCNNTQKSNSLFVLLNDKNLKLIYKKKEHVNN